MAEVVMAEAVMAEVIMVAAIMVAATQTTASLLDLATISLGRTITPITTLHTITHPIIRTTPITIHPG
jgi:hypothetical protein